MRRTTLALGAAVLFAAAVMPFLGVLDADLVWDDRNLILEDTRFGSPRALALVLGGDFFGSTDEAFKYGYWRPLTTLTYYATWRLVGPAPFAYHLSNVVLHAATTLLLALLLLRLAPHRPAAALLGGLLFAVHPVHVESVAWVSGRTDLLCALGVLATLLALVWRHREALGGEPCSRPGLALAAAGAAFALALLSKEMALALPVAAAALVVLDRQRHRWLATTATLVGVSVAYLVVRALATDAPVAPPPRSLAALAALVPGFFQTFGRYALELVMPLPVEPYLQNPAPSAPLTPAVAAGLGIAAALAWTGWRLRRRRPAVALLVLLLLASFAPLANLVRITGPADMGLPMAERFLYLPSAFACGLVGLGLAALNASRPRWRPGISAAVVATVALGAVGSWHGARTWRDEITLFATMVRQTPAAPLPRVLLGTWHRRQGKLQAARRELETALALIPPGRAGEQVAALNNLAGVELAEGRLGRARALLESASSFDAGRAIVANNLALVARLEGRLEDAVALLEQSLAADPRHPRARAQLGEVLVELGRPGDALPHLELSLERTGDRVDVLVAAADAHGRLGHRAAAAAMLERAARLAPGSPEVELPRGKLALADGRPEAARRAFEAVLARHPDNPTALNGAALAAAAGGDLARARTLLERAAAVAPDDPEILLNLAQTELSSGDREGAESHVRAALALRPEDRRARAAAAALGITTLDVTRITK